MRLTLVLVSGYTFVLITAMNHLAGRQLGVCGSYFWGYLVFDVRALLVGKQFRVGDGVYLEREPEKVLWLEQKLRAFWVGFRDRKTKVSSPFVQQVHQHDEKLRALSDRELRYFALDLGRKMQILGLVDELLAPMFSAIREASRRTLGKSHHDVQLLAGLALLRGEIAEMATGEGKTLSGTLGICTCAMAGASVHVVTVNDYLAERDAEENRPLFRFFRLRVGIVLQKMTVPERAKAYANPVVYVSNKELTFDYLKDRIAVGSSLSSHLDLRKLAGESRTATSTILKGLHVAIVDEADSVLIDEARTPLIISETLPDEIDESVYHNAVDLVQNLQEGVDFKKGQHRDIWLTEQGLKYVSRLVQGWGGIWNSALWQKELMNKALSACHLFHKDQHYIVAENKVQIVDEFTGRVMPDRTWERGLHQLIEAKEKCEITGQRRTLSQITYQRFFSKYLLLCGMTGTAQEVAAELKHVYNLSVMRIPTHKPGLRIRLPDKVFHCQADKWQAVARSAMQVALTGRSVLVGTRSVEASEALSACLKDLDVDHTVLNARQDKEEALAISKAGQPGCITVATNMAGRGTDIKLDLQVEQEGGLHVILTEFHESGRIDRQLFGRAARQGNPGTAQAIVAWDDELFTRYAPWLSHVCRHITKPTAVFRFLVWHAQNKAERQHRKQRLDTLKRDIKWLRALGFVGVDQK
jgi:preprotein translocase subunit SecA